MERYLKKGRKQRKGKNWGSGLVGYTGLLFQQEPPLRPLRFCLQAAVEQRYLSECIIRLRTRSEIVESCMKVRQDRSFGFGRNEIDYLNVYPTNLVEMRATWIGFQSLKPMSLRKRIFYLLSPELCI